MKSPIKLLAATLAAFCLSLPPGVSAQTASVTTVNLTAEPGDVQVIAQGEVAEMQLEVIDSSGEVVFESGMTNNHHLEWNMLDARGERVSSGSYMCTITFRDSKGKVRKRIEQVTVGLEEEASAGMPAPQPAALPNEVTPLIHDDTLRGDGITGSPLSVAMPLHAEDSGIGFGVTSGQRVHLPADTMLQLGNDGLGRGNLRFSTILPGKEFSFDVSEQYPGDPVLSIGYNSRAAKRILTNEPAIFHTIEGDYGNQVNGVHYFEMNTQVIGRNGVQRRLQAFSVRRDDVGEPLWMWAGDEFRFLPTNGLAVGGDARAFLQVNVPGKYGFILGSWGVGVTNPGFLTPGNRVIIPNNTFYGGLNSAGTGVVSLLGMNNENRTVIGGTQVNIGNRLLLGSNQLTTAALTIYGASGSENAQKIRIGHSPTVDYSIYRNQSNGWLTFKGTQGGIYVGYSFDAPVEAKSISLGGGVTWTKGIVVPQGACTTGSLYTNTRGQASNTLYVCAAGVWVAK